MNKRRFTEKQNEITRKNNKKKALENRIARLERSMNEVLHPASFLLVLAEEGQLSWETLARKLLSECQVEDLQRVCKLLGVADDDAFIDDDADLWNESICRTSHKGKRFFESAFDTAMLYLRIENDKIDRIGSSIVFNSQMNERFAQKMDKRSFELIKHNAEGLLNKECNELVERLNSLVSYCDDAIDAVDQD